MGGGGLSFKLQWHQLSSRGFISRTSDTGIYGRQGIQGTGIQGYMNTGDLGIPGYMENRGYRECRECSGYRYTGIPGYRDTGETGIYGKQEI